MQRRRSEHFHDCSAATEAVTDILPDEKLSSQPAHLGGASSRLILATYAHTCFRAAGRARIS
jgi:hypothetical protein